MTDQTIPAGLNRDEASAVREWAERALAVEVQDETVAHAARVLLAVLPTPPTTAKENPELPDQTLDDQVRPIVAAMIDTMRDAMRRDAPAYSDGSFLVDMSGYIRDLAELCAPALPTLADMTDEERAACQWMQADVAGHNTRYVITNPCDEDDDAVLLDADGAVNWISPERITPRPDLPRMTWPGTDQEADQ